MSAFSKVLSMSLTKLFISKRNKNAWNSVKAPIIANNCVYTYAKISTVVFGLGVPTTFLQQIQPMFTFSWLRGYLDQILKYLLKPKYPNTLF